MRRRSAAAPRAADARPPGAVARDPIGRTDVQINRSHFLGHRFHTGIAGLVRLELEKIPDWSVRTPSGCRASAYDGLALRRKRIVSIGDYVNSSIQRVPIGVMTTGFAIAAYDLYAT